MSSLRLLAMPMLVMAAVAVAPTASADTVGQDTYAVPEAMGYGKYTAGIAEGSAGCTYSTYDGAGQPITSASSFVKPMTVAVDSTVASFRTKGCTPWVRVSRVLN